MPKQQRAPVGIERRLPILSDVAEEAAVSLTTASRALDPDNDHPVSDRTRARVLAAATRLDYRPNPMARALRTRRVPTIAVVVHDVSDPYFAEIVRGATAAASARGFLTVVCSSDRDSATELRYVEMLCLSRVSGVLFAGGGVKRGLIYASDGKTVLPLSEARHALELSETGHARGKIVLKVA